MRKILSALLLFSLMLSFLYLAPIQASAIDWALLKWTDCSDFNSAMSMMQSSSANIRLTKDVGSKTSHTNGQTHYDRYSELYHIKGKIVLDLNGHELSYKWCEKESACWFVIESGGDLTIIDTSKDKAGRLFFDGWAEEWDHSYFGFGANSHEDADGPQRRDLIRIKSGGKLTVNAGKLQAGRAEKQWVTASNPELNSYNSLLYAGNAQMLISGDTVFAQSGSTFVMNGGKLISNGFRSYKLTFEIKDNYVVAQVKDKVKACCIRCMSDSNITINDGVLLADTCSNCMSDTGANIRIKSGEFKTDNCSTGRIIVGYYDQGHINPHLISKSLHMDGRGYGSIGIPSTAFDKNNSTVYQNNAAVYNAGNSGDTTVTPKVNRDAFFVGEKDAAYSDLITVAPGTNRTLTLFDISTKKAFAPYYEETAAQATGGSVTYCWCVSKTSLPDYEQCQNVLKTTSPTVNLTDLSKVIAGGFQDGQVYYIGCYCLQSWKSNHSYLMKQFGRDLTLKYSSAAIPSAAVSFSGASISGGQISSSNTLGNITFSSSTAGVASVKAEWYEDSRLCSNFYGESGWKSQKIKNNSQYCVRLTLTAKSGYAFTKDTKVTLGGENTDFFSLSSDGKTLAVYSKDWSSPCNHSSSGWETDDMYHWHKCSLCGSVYQKDAHKWDSGTSSGGNITYRCTVCGATRKESTGSSSMYVSTIYYDLGQNLAGDTYGYTYDPTNKGIKSHTERMTFGSSKTSQPSSFALGSKYSAGTFYRFEITLDAQSGYYFSNTLTSVYVYINGSSQVARTVSLTDSQATFEVIFEVFSAPDIVFTLPDDIKPGDDLIQLSTLCGVSYNGKPAETIMLVITADGNLLAANTYTNGAWGYLNTENLLNAAGGSLSPAEKEQARAMYSAQPGVLYLYAFMSLDSYPISTTRKDKYTVRGAANAISVETADVSASATYKPQYQYLPSVEITGSAPVAGKMPDKKIGGKIEYEWNTAQAFTCGKSYTVSYTVHAEGNNRFETGCQVSYNGESVPFTLLNDKTIQFSYTYPELPHVETATLVESTCTKAGTITNKCAVCGKELYTSSLPLAKHALTHYDAVDGSCVEAGTNEYYYCASCGGLFSDENGEHKITAPVKGAKNKSNHVGGAIENDKDSHWVHCQCGDILDKAAHTFGSDGICSVCGYEKGKDETLPKQTTGPDDTTGPNDTTGPDNGDDTSDVPGTSGDADSSVIPVDPNTSGKPGDPDRPDAQKSSFNPLIIVLGVIILLILAGIAAIILLLVKSKTEAKKNGTNGVDPRR